MESRVFLAAFLVTWLLFAFTNGHRFEQITSCTCPGYQIEYYCTTFGRGSTVWHGSAFDCPLNEILLRHSQFPNGNLRGECNSGNICAHAENTGEDNTFVSRLIANVTSFVVNKTITCSYDDGSRQHLVNTTVVSLTTAPFPPPMNVKLSSAGESYLNFSWSDAVRPSCPTLYYKINTTNCGTCPTSTNKTEIQCTGFEVSTERQICKLSVQTVACNNLTGQRSNEIYVTLQLPDSPDSILIVPQYRQNGQLQKLHTTIATPQGFMVFGNTSGSPISYTFHYFHGATHMTCGSSTTSCNGGNCTDVFNFQLSRCSTNPDISVNVYATNIFGSSPLSNTTTTSVTNNFMQISVHNNIITCYFPGYYMIGSISCKVVNITDENCEEPLSWSITSENLTHNSTTFVLKLPPNLSAYCLTLSGNNGSSFAVIQDTFVINRGARGSNETSTAVAIACTIIIVMIFVILTLAALTSYIVLRKAYPKKKVFLRVSCDDNLTLMHSNSNPMDNNEDVAPTYCDLKKLNPIDYEDQVEVIGKTDIPNDPLPSYYAISFFNPITD